MGKISNAEKQKKCRQKNIEKYRAKNRERMAAKRRQQKKLREADPNLKEEYRLKKRLQMREYRKRKAEIKKSALEASIAPIPSTSRGPYQTPQSFGKAVAKAECALPISPRKKRAVVRKLVLDVGLKLPTERQIRNTEFTETKLKVEEFFIRTDIVYTAPGIKDEIIVWKEGEKHRERKYYLTVSLKEAYNIFTEDFPENPIGFSTFCKLRPKNVLLLHQTPADQCKCRICENLFLKLKALKITYDDKFWEKCLCDPQKNSNCWKSTCNKGQHKSYLICSNTNKKDKNTVSHFINILYENMTPSPKEIPDMRKLFGQMVHHPNLKKNLCLSILKI